MAKLTDSQIAKLSPEQRKARAKRLEYNKRYDAAKRDGKTVRKVSKGNKSIVVAKKQVEAANERVAKLEAHVAELNSLAKRELELLAEIRKLAE